MKSSVNWLSYVTTILNSTSVPRFTEKEIRNVILCLNKYDALPSNIDKQCIALYIKPLSMLINASFEQGIFPDESKIV